MKREIHPIRLSPPRRLVWLRVNAAGEPYPGTFLSQAEARKFARAWYSVAGDRIVAYEAVASVAALFKATPKGRADSDTPFTRKDSGDT